MRTKQIRLMLLTIWHLLLVSCLIPLTADAQSAFELIERNHSFAAGNYGLYPEEDLPQLTPAPEGYEPFYINHYGCSSSYYLDRPSSYEGPYAILLRADSLVTIHFSPDLLSRIASENPKHLMTPRLPFVVKDFSPGSLGKSCGMLVGDSLVAVNDIPTPSTTQLTDALTSCAGDSITLHFFREGKPCQLRILLGNDGKLGIYAVNDISQLFDVKHIDYTLLQAIPAGISYGWETLVTYASSLKILFTRDGTKSLGGFISMASIFPDFWDWQAFWNLTALLAIVLAFMNVIPIPGLDGGHIVITLWEMITRRPVNPKALDILQNIGLFLLIALMVVANGNDLIKVFQGLMR